jgi:hypothetical protein
MTLRWVGSKEVLVVCGWSLPEFSASLELGDPVAAAAAHRGGPAPLDGLRRCEGRGELVAYGAVSGAYAPGARSR